MDKNQKRSFILCVKAYVDEGWVDFREGELYQIESVDEEDKTCYIISEDGSSVQFEFDEIPAYFESKLIA